MQAEFDAFRLTSEQMLDAKDFQLQQSLETNAELRSQSSSLRRELVRSTNRNFPLSNFPRRPLHDQASINHAPTG